MKPVVTSFVFTLLLLTAAAQLALRDARADDLDADGEQREDVGNHIAISPDMARRSGLVTARAEGGELAQTLRFYGTVAAEPSAVRHLAARYPGVVRQVKADIGDRVEQGDILAVVEADDSLRPYQISAPMAGVVIARRANEGEATGDSALFTLIDPARMQVEFPVFAGDAAAIKPGQTLRLALAETVVATRIGTLTPAVDGTPALLARAPLDNGAGQWVAGTRTPLTVVVAQDRVALRVDNRGLQQINGAPVVFVQTGDGYEARPLALGRTDDQFSEVLDGLAPGETYVVENAYLLKADLEKSSVEDDD